MIISETPGAGRGDFAGLRDEKGNQRAEFSKEGVHMYPAAYVEVFRALRPYL